MNYLEVDTYLQLEPRDRAYRLETKRYDGKARAMQVVSQTARRPLKPKPGTIVVKIRLRVPTAAFDPLQPEAVVTIPTDMTEPHPIEVEATEPS